MLYIPNRIPTFGQESWISTWEREYRRKVVELATRWIWRWAEGKDLGSGCGSGRLRVNVNNSLDVNRAPSWGRRREALKSSVRRLSPHRQGPIVTLHPPRLEKKTQLSRPWRLYPVDRKLGWHVKNRTLSTCFYSRKMFRSLRETYRSHLRILRLG